MGNNLFLEFPISVCIDLFPDEPMLKRWKCNLKIFLLKKIIINESGDLWFACHWVTFAKNNIIGVLFSEPKNGIRCISGLFLVNIKKYDDAAKAVGSKSLQLNISLSVKFDMQIYRKFLKNELLFIGKWRMEIPLYI